MHEPLKERIEDYLQGGNDLPDVERHLEQCESCRAEVIEMKKHSELLRSMKAPREWEPSPGFYGRVMNRIETQAKPSVWNLWRVHFRQAPRVRISDIYCAAGDIFRLRYQLRPAICHLFP